MADRVDAAMQAMEPSTFDTTLNGRTAQPDSDELTVRDNAMLALRQGRDRHVGWWIE